ncbi:MAG: hypothetical protein PF961_11740 [Planctomycetota bacterium]|nr:hypothetical protein [Planctomycetota bacterium]
MTKHLPILALLCLAGLVPAAEIVIRDVRAAVLVRATDFDFDLSAPNRTQSGSDAFNSGTGLELGVRYGFSGTGSSVGLIVGGDLNADWYSYDGDDGLANYGLRGCVAGGWSPIDRWTFMLEGGLGAGYSSLSLPASDASAAFEADGSSLAYDARLVTMFRMSKRWAVHGHLGYMAASNDLSGDDIDITIDQGGLFAGVGVTWMFSTRPTRLE